MLRFMEWEDFFDVVDNGDTEWWRLVSDDLNGVDDHGEAVHEVIFRHKLDDTFWRGYYWLHPRLGRIEDDRADLFRVVPRTVTTTTWEKWEGDGGATD